MAAAEVELPFHLRGNYAPVEREVTAFDLPVKGAIPRALSGLSPQRAEPEARHLAALVRRRRHGARRAARERARRLVPQPLGAHEDAREPRAALRAGQPLYGISVARTIMEDIRLEMLHPQFVAQARASGVSLKDLRREIALRESIQHLTQLPHDLRRLFVTAHDIAPAHHVRMQAIFQRHSDSGVSKTINLPHNATPQDVAAAFLLAH